MPRRGHAYPQVDPGAVGLIDTAIATVAPGVGAGEALRLARRRDARVVQVGRAFVLRADLARADALGLADLPARLLARPLPVVEGRVAETVVRRRLARGASAVVVRQGGVARGAVTGAGETSSRVALPARWIERLPAGLPPLLARAREVAQPLGVRLFLAGGLVRDAVAATAAAGGRDVDLVVEGDGVGFARALAAALGARAGAPVEHDRFLTASLVVEGVGRVDVATARAERYEQPGALPRVVPATIGQDLGRRDFTVNALAVDVTEAALELLDPFDGRGALARRRLAVLHPLSFVEDPTRIFRAARYGARLGASLDGWSARARALALGLAPYPALSGQRLLAEIALIAGESRLAEALGQLGAWGALRLLDPEYRFPEPTATRLPRLAPALEWAAAHGLDVVATEIVLVALLADQPRAVADRALRRLGLTGEPRRRVERSLEAVLAPVPGRRPSERARALRGQPDLALAWRWVAGSPAERAEVAWFARDARWVRTALGGDEVVELGVPRGPAVGEVLAALRDARVDGRVHGADEEARLVRDIVGRRREEG
jgi:tRNA nucleotidyltransferase (CCA-adding enzyme)